MTVLLVILFRKKDYLMDDQEYYKKIKKINKENLYKQIRKNKSEKWEKNKNSEILESQQEASNKSDK